MTTNKIPFTRIASAPDGGSKFIDDAITVEPAGDLNEKATDAVSQIFSSKRFDVKEVYFRTTDNTYDYDWHNAPQRQFVVIITGSARMTTTDGESRVFGPGSIVLAEDTKETGTKGHKSVNIGDEIRKSIFLVLGSDELRY